MKINYYTKTKERNIGDFDTIDNRFEKKLTSYNDKDSRLYRRRPVKKYYRVPRIEFTTWEWMKLFGILIIIFIIYCWYIGQ